MNTNTRRRRLGLSKMVDFQTATTEKPTEATDNTEETTVAAEDNEFGSILTSTFSVKVKGEGEDGKEKVLYENKKEPFKYQTVGSVVSLLKYLGAKNFPDANVDILGKALTSEDENTSKEIGEAIAEVLKIANAKFKSDAKSSAYQSIVNKYSPLEGEKRMTAIARTINNFVKLAGITPEVAIEVLRSKGAVPEDYTVQDYKETKLRKSKDDSAEEED